MDCEKRSKALFEDALNFVVINLLVDLLYAALNPEISYK